MCAVCLAYKKRERKVSKKEKIFGRDVSCAVTHRFFSLMFVLALKNENLLCKSHFRAWFFVLGENRLFRMNQPFKSLLRNLFFQYLSPLLVAHESGVPKNWKFFGWHGTSLKLSRGYPNCLRRFFHARAVARQEYHYQLLESSWTYKFTSFVSECLSLTQTRSWRIRCHARPTA